MKISIATSYYNRKPQFINTLKTIQKSKQINNTELIVVDDCSADEHRLDDIPQQYPFVKVIRLESKDRWYTNPCVPFNKAIKEATGDVIILQNPECLHVGDKNNMFGKSHTELTKSKIANKAIGRKCSDETKIKMSLKRKGKSQKDETKLKISLASPKRRGVFQLELNGVFIKKWDSITEASRALKIKKISDVCRGDRKTAGGFKWQYLENNNNNNTN